MLTICALYSCSERLYIPWTLCKWGQSRYLLAIISFLTPDIDPLRSKIKLTYLRLHCVIRSKNILENIRNALSFSMSSLQFLYFIHIFHVNIQIIVTLAIVFSQSQFSSIKKEPGITRIR